MSLGVLCGSSLLESDQFAGLPERIIETDRGDVRMKEGSGFYLIQRHRSGDDGYNPPHEIDHKSHILALLEVGVKRIFAVQSTGTLTNQIPSGTFAIPDDFINLWERHTFYDDRRGHGVAEFNGTLRKSIREVLKEKNLHFSENAVYVQTLGPRFETPAEGRLLKDMADIVGMTAASEVILASEKELPYATLCCVDNYVNGIEDTSVDYESFRQNVRKNEAKVIRAVEGVIELLT